MPEIVGTQENSGSDQPGGEIARHPLSPPLPLSGARSMNSDSFGFSPDSRASDGEEEDLES